MVKPGSIAWAVLGAALFAAACSGDGAPSEGDPGAGGPAEDSHWYDDGMAARGIGRPKVTYPVKRGISPPLRALALRTPALLPRPERERLDAPVRAGAVAAARVAERDPLVQDAAVNLAPDPTLSFDGLSNADNQEILGGGVTPPDTNGDVGPNHVVEYINLIIGIYDKAGNQLAALPGNAPWAGFGGDCEFHNDGDPIVVYDQLADRWVFSQFALFTPTGGHQCFAVSQTPDPLGPYFLYDYVFTPGLNDYPKMGVWPDAYYTTFNNFDPAFTSAVAVAVDRSAMLLGLPAAMVRFDVLSTPDDTFFSLQPAHLEGLALPPAGAPGFLLMAFDDETWSLTPDPTADHYNLWAMSVDFTDPGNSALVGPIEIPTAEFDAEFCGFARNCIEQPPGGELLDTLGQFTMFRLAYRNFGTHESLVINHSADMGGDRAGIRWAELRNPNTAPVVNDTGTFAPDDGLSRWMGSASIDGAGNIAIGYSVSSATTFPGLRYAARLADDPPGELGQGEAVLVEGSTAVNGGFNRWGDYASLSVDEADDCTFWFVGEYGSDAVPGDWSTRIASFQLPLCTATEVGTIAGTVRRGNGQPLAGATIRAGSFSAVSGADGTYSLRVPAGTHDVTASAFGFVSQTVAGVVVADEQTVTLNFRLVASPRVKVSGVVTDDGEAGWPLYARLTFTSAGAPALDVFTDPLTGFYAVRLPAGTDFEVTVEAQVPGYLPETRPVTPGPGDTVQNFALEVNTGTCDALGYTLTEIPLATEPFETAFPPAGWTVESATTGCEPPGVGAWTGDDVGGRGNLTGGSGGFAIADSDLCGPTVSMSTTLTSPPIDLSGLTDDQGLQIQFDQDLRTLPDTSAIVEVWNGVEWVVISNQQVDSRTQTITIGTKAANGVADAQVRFTYLSAWDWWWELDNVVLAVSSCDYQGGGLVFGTVNDRNTRTAVNGATVSTPGQPGVTTVPTPLDPNLPDGLYFTFITGRAPITVSAPGYASRTVNVTPQIGGVVRRNLFLEAGRVNVSPTDLAIRVPYRGSASATFTLVNDGTAPATVTISEIEGPPSTITVGPFAPTSRLVGAKEIAARDARSRRQHTNPVGRPLAAGDVVQVIDTGLAGPWGMGFDVPSQSGWVSDIGVLAGDDRLHQFLLDGTSTGETAPSSTPSWGADLAYDPRNDTLWQVNVGGDNCIHEIDLGTRDFTGQTICPPFGTTERGLAYDPVTDTFYAGSWTDARIIQFDRDGTILRAVSTGLSTSGLAYNASTGHLFVAVNDLASLPLIFVFDTAGDLTLIGQFDITQGGTDLFGDFSGAGLELDCSGNLWVVNQATQIIAVADSNEPAGCQADLPWVETSPNPVTIPAGGSVEVTVTVDASNLTPGLHEVQLLLQTDTPYDVPAVALHATVAFNDVAEGSFGDAEIHGLAGAGISFGCDPGRFCPSDDLTRVVYPVWGLKAAFGSEYDSPHPTGLLFDDLSPKEFGADFAEDAFTRGLVDGCGVRLYCPDQAVTKREAAVFGLRLLFGAEHEPPPASGLYTDVAPEDAPFVEDAVGRGFIEACGATTFCPGDSVDRASAAVIFVRAFGIRTFP